MDEKTKFVLPIALAVAFIKNKSQAHVKRSPASSLEDDNSIIQRLLHLRVNTANNVNDNNNDLHNILKDNVLQLQMCLQMEQDNLIINKGLLRLNNNINNDDDKLLEYITNNVFKTVSINSDINDIEKILNMMILTSTQKDKFHNINQILIKGTLNGLKLLCNIENLNPISHQKIYQRSERLVKAICYSIQLSSSSNNNDDYDNKSLFLN